MVAALAIIWVGFNFMSGGKFLTARNLWNLSVQSASIAVMATGMVLIIVSRNIDLSVGSILGLTGYVMAMIQAVWIPQPEGLNLGFGQAYTWIVALGVGLLLGAAIGGFQGVLIAFTGIPAFIVTLGGLLVWRGLVFEIYKGQTIAPMDKTFSLLGGGPIGSVGEVPSWIIGVLACAAIVYTLVSSRRRRRHYGFPVRPMWAEVTLGVLGSVAVLGAVAIANSYYWPPELAKQQFGPNARLDIPVGIAIPVLIMLGVTLVMTFLTTRRRFGRYVFAIGGNPEAAELGGINTRRTIVGTFALMGLLCAISAAIQSARLDSAVTSLGTQNELDVIAAAVIGGTSFSGGIGTIPGAVLGAVVMQSLRSGMLILNVDSPIQDIVVGSVLVAAVGLDTIVRRRSA
jgi:D-xylose transport system permease protein